MKVFDIVKRVLDQEYSFIYDNNKDDLIRDRLEELGNTYASINKKKGPDFSDPVTRFAYIYRYTTSHANIVFDMITELSHLSEMFQRQEIDVSCIGGGPGSDLLGIYKFVLSNSCSSSMTFNMIDKEDSWGESWSDVDKMTRSYLQSSTNFRHIDICDPSSWGKYRKYLKSDLFTFVYFVSEIYSMRNAAAPYFLNLLNSAKPGARFMYVDNFDAATSDLFCSLCTGAGLTCRHRSSADHTLGVDEQKTDLREYFQKFSYPKLTASLSTMVLEK